MGEFQNQRGVRWANFVCRITPWLDGMGTQNCFISAAFVGLAVVSVFLLFKYGKLLREESRVRYWQLVKENMEDGVSH